MFYNLKNMAGVNSVIVDKDCLNAVNNGAVAKDCSENIGYSNLSGDDSQPICSRHLLALLDVADRNIGTYSCQNCFYKIRTKDSLKIHNIYGCGEPRFTRDTCAHDEFEDCTVKNCILKSHKKYNYSPRKYFTCVECERRYSSKTSLTFHMKSKHPK